MPSLKLIPLYLLYLTTFGLAALTKLSPLLKGWTGAPEWFQKQFGETFLNAFPGALTLNFYFIALVETAVTVLFVLSLIRREFLPGQKKSYLLFGLLVAQLGFVMLGIGLRVSQDFHGAAELFFYFGVTLIASRYVEDQFRLESLSVTNFGNQVSRESN